MHHTGDVAIRMNSAGAEYRNMHIVGNHIHDTSETGEGMYLGCNSDGCRLIDSVIERNYIHHTNGPSIVQGDGIEIKEGSYGNIVRDNVIHDTNYPCILTYSTVGNGPPNIIERNVMWNCADNAIQSAADATIRNNIILGAGGNGLAMQPHQAGTPSNLIVVHNTIIQPTNAAIRISGATGTVLIANNAIYGGATAINYNGGGTVTFEGNVGIGSLSGVSSGFTMGDLGADFVGANAAGGVPNDVFPAAGSALIGAGVAAHVPADDFNGTARGGAADVGAYAFDSGGNPGWTLAEAFKGSTSIPPDDAGASMDAGGRRDTSTPGADSATERDSSSGADGSTTPVDGGCDCSVGVRARHGAPLGFALVGLALFLRRRR